MREKDIKIINHVRANARKSLTKIAREMYLPVTTVFDRLKVSEKKHILRYVALLNYNSLGYSAKTHLIVSLDDKDKEAFRNYIMQQPSTNNFFQINSSYNFFVESIFKDIKEAHQFMQFLKARFNFKENISYFVLDDITRENFQIKI